MRVAESVLQAEQRLREQHTRLKPELQRLVLMCDLLAAKLRETQHRDAPRLLNELCAIRSPICRPNSTCGQRPCACFLMNFPKPRGCARPRGTTRPAMEIVSHGEFADRLILSTRRRYQPQGPVSANPTGDGTFLPDCANRCFESSRNAAIVPQPVEPRAQADFEELLRSATGLSMEDVQAAATRLGLETRQDDEAPERIETGTACWRL